MDITKNPNKLASESGFELTPPETRSASAAGSASAVGYVLASHETRSRSGSAAEAGSELAPREQSPIEQCFRAKLVSLDATLEKKISNGSKIDKQIIKNININSDYETIISAFIHKNIKPIDKVLVVDYENIIYTTLGAAIRDDQGIRLRPDPSNRDVLLPNVPSNKIDYYRVSTFFILNYALVNRFTSIFIICKKPKNFDYFKKDYDSIVHDGYIDLNVQGISTRFNCTDIQTALIQGNIKCMPAFIESSCHTICKDSEEACVHRLMGCDDSITVIIYCLLKSYIENQTDNLKIMSRDLRSFRDFVNDQQYYVPFDLTMTNLTTGDTIELIVNFVLKKFDLPVGIDDNTVGPNRVIPYYDDIYYYYYNQSRINDTRTGYNVRNWYKMNQDLSINTHMNTSVPQNTDFFTESYLKRDRASNFIPNLNSSGYPYLDQNGNITRLTHHPTVPYVEWNNRTRSYVPAEEKVLEPYYFVDRRSGNKKIATINLANGSLINYCKLNRATGTWEPALDPTGNAYRNEYGILSIIVGTHSNGRNKYEPYCEQIRGRWFANLKISYKPYKYGGQIDTINIYEWQPYLNKYRVSEQSEQTEQTENSKYYKKYLKYKAKYTALKQKLKL